MLLKIKEGECLDVLQGIAVSQSPLSNCECFTVKVNVWQLDLNNWMPNFRRGFLGIRGGALRVPPSFGRFSWQTSFFGEPGTTLGDTSTPHNAYIFGIRRARTVIIS